MASEQHFFFPPFRLDALNEQLWQGDEKIPLRRKTFAVLRHLIEHSGQLVTKEQLLKTVWAGTYVSESMPTTCVRELRKALRDEAKTPQFIETVHGRGYRFIALLTATPPVSGSRFQASGTKAARSHGRRRAWNVKRETPLVGREPDLAQLHQWLAKALNGERQIVFVSGEPGIGKTTIVEAFLEQIVTDEKVWIGWGQCIEHYGAGEAYMPVLEALGRLCRESGGERLIDLLSQHAPTWLVQMPGLLNATDIELVQRKVQGATQERMLREMAEVVETVVAEHPLILRLEDLHWSDVSTLELLSVLARRQETAQLLVIGSYRPVEMLGNGHPLRTLVQELQLHGQCEELRLGLLTEQHVAEYLVSRLAVGTYSDTSLQQMARAIYQRTDGNPLFMVNVVNDLLTRDAVDSRAVEMSIPLTIRQMTERQLDHLPTFEQRMLEAASVAGVQFSAAAVAAGLQVTTGEVEVCCSGLARRKQFLRETGISEWPDGTVAACYSFLHALYQEVLYERVLVGQRIDFHRRIGEREEHAYGAHAREIAAELAVHFERGRDYGKTVQFLQQAGENALRRSAHREAISLLTKGLELLKTLPNMSERIQQELTLQLSLGTSLVAIKGYAAPEVGEAYARARELYQEVEETPQLFPILWGLWAFHCNRAELLTARELAEQQLVLAQSIQDPVLLVEARFALGVTLFFLGEFIPAQKLLEYGVALYDPQQHHALAFLRGYDPGVATLSWAAHVWWYLGYPDQALTRSQEALVQARGLSHTYSLAFALGHNPWIHLYRREWQVAREQTEVVMTLCAEQGFAQVLAQGCIQRGWALAEQGQIEEGISQMRQSLAVWRATGTELWLPYYLALLAEVYGKVGRVEEGLALLAEAMNLMRKTGERSWEAELYRLKGELTLQQFKVQGSKSQITNPQSEAEACFHKAIAVAQKQQAKSLELRATMSLVRLRQQQATHHETSASRHAAHNRLDEARTMLSDVYRWFTEGFETKDLREAKALLDSLASRI